MISPPWEPRLHRRGRRTQRIPRQWQLTLMWILLVFSVVAWRQGALFTGGVDSVVILKALLQSSILCWVVLLNLWSSERQLVGVRSIMLVAPTLALSIVGALAEGNLMASAIIAIRMTMLATTILLIMRIFPAEQVVSSLCIGMATVGMVSAISGLALGGAAGRLSGGIPPLSPNEIALLSGFPALVLFHQALRAQVRWWHIVALGVLSGILLLSESRTALFAAAVAAVMMLLMLRKLPVQTIVAGLITLPIASYLIFATSIIQHMMAREDSASVMTLNSRTISWSVVLNLPIDSWQRWIGAGMSQKTIAVQGQYWDEQVFDSSWISLLAQTGIIGTALIGIWVIATIHSAITSKKLRSLLLPLIAFLLIRSVMENGLLDAGALFLSFLVIALMLEPVSKSEAFDWDNSSLLKQPNSAPRFS
ncbi:O-antigen ligase family protein [Glutamicibacter sp. JC586]|uniref:O-antigen ligase family protein n=1 Tax=Glutamicibacter sp. JC586 TaxID=2590552 RepID=UPI00135B416F|nr:O-antigen ligase family protein [Glutamicibacter sp. JC586]